MSIQIFFCKICKKTYYSIFEVIENPYHLSSEKTKYQHCLEALVFFKNDVNKKDGCGYTPLYAIASNFTEDYCTDGLKFLLENGADPNISSSVTNLNSQYPLHKLIFHAYYIKSFCQTSINNLENMLGFEKIVSEKEKCVELFEVSKEKCAEKHKTSKEKCEKVLETSKEKCAKNLLEISKEKYEKLKIMIELFLIHNANPHLQNSFGFSPYEKAVEFHLTDIIKLFDKYDFVIFKGVN